MNATSLRRWHWTLIGLLVGALYGYVRESSANFYDELTSFNARRIGQREFEAAVTSDFHGKRRFSDLVVRPYRLAASGGPTVTVHIVAGLYFDGRTQVENGRVAARWEPAYFVASAPYFPIAAPARSPAATSPAAAAISVMPAQLDSVMSYLRALPQGQPIPFEYASWWWATRPQFLWTCVGVFVIGGVWPTIVNLLAFGSLTRPAEAKGLSLWRATPAPSDASPGSAALDPAALEAFERGLADAAAAPPDPAPAAPPQPAIRALRGAAETEAAAAAAATQEQKDFGKADEDFYPTEIHARHET